MHSNRFRPEHRLIEESSRNVQRFRESFQLNLEYVRAEYTIKLNAIDHLLDLNRARDRTTELCIIL